MVTAIAEADKQEVQEAIESTRAGRVFVPRADIFESQDKLVVLADMPGVDESSVEITVENNILTLQGFVKAPVRDGYRPVLTEYGVGDFRRSFTLSNAIDREGIEAACKNGVLTLTLPKSKSLLPKKVTVKAVSD
ncbi:MAG TPA: Hsp20/alpha crystallin family protein [Candidatus Obscuribacter sp.]|nr:Hsp20/alpha crystallin family protein [Candidatus Obscuribacter sp.]HMY54560.1 Hsp20/alpha crystallin family protein [Candidatus Obscuribacter sp.]HNA72766.1 Hsp20/alpha crystallin family protein [Candidatus Obscuribacter sp.]HNB17188.1 Hsp20/alpha crystallin family protein [Candidatus Obscuribacter sp.]HND67683.1 Hsp20/alpha crystallin family protein [Candidatus Obscuribacter sp.]